MAVIPTGAIYKALKFDNTSSRNYGVYITGQAVFNAPQRDVEMITIPNRNGSFALDNGRFENVEVTYPAGIFADTEEDFAQAISDFRNFLCSKRGYCRLEDDYNPDEYRMAIYKSGLEVTPAQLKAGEFEITFDCKPQRWLTSGEVAVTTTSGDTLINPTSFDSSPLLEVGGNGTIEFNGYEIEFAGTLYGEIVIGNKSFYNLSSTATVTLDTSKLNIGDAIYPEVKECLIERQWRGKRYFPMIGVNTTVNVLDATLTEHKQGNFYYLRMSLFPDFGDGFVYGTPETIISSAMYRFTYGVTTYGVMIRATITYDGADTYTVSINSGTTPPEGVISGTPYMDSPTMYGDSTKFITDSIFVDCDLGETYIIDNGVYRSLNQYFDLGSDLPKLAVGSNTITFDNTITLCKITPRWWKV